MRQDDAAEPRRGLYICQEARKERVFPTQSWHDQRAQEGAEAREGGGWGRGDYFEDTANEVRAFLLNLRAGFAYVALGRSGTSDFIAQQIQIMTKMQQEQEKRAKELDQRKLKRPSAALQPRS